MFRQVVHFGGGGHGGLNSIGATVAQPMPNMSTWPSPSSPPLHALISGSQTCFVPLPCFKQSLLLPGGGREGARWSKHGRFCPGPICSWSPSKASPKKIPSRRRKGLEQKLGVNVVGVVVPILILWFRGLPAQRRLKHFRCLPGVGCQWESHKAVHERRSG